MATVGRNDPCPCGSGAKYKKCCLPLNSTTSLPLELQRALSWHQADQEHSATVLAWTARHHREWLEEARALIIDEAFPDEESLIPFVTVYLCWHYQSEDDGPTPAELYLRAESRRVRDTAWFAAQATGYLSLWEVLEVKPGQWLKLKDLLTGNERQVWERSGSVEAHTRMVLLARVVELDDGLCVLAGCYPMALPLTQALEVKKSFLEGSFPRRKKLRPEELRMDEAFLDLTAEFDLGLIDLYDGPPPQLTNFHGEAMKWTVDRFRFPAAKRSEVLERMQALGEFHDDAVNITEDSPNGPVSVAFLTAKDKELHLQTNSLERADRLTARVQELGKGLWKHTAREHPEGPELPSALPEGPPPPEVVEHIRKYRQELMDGWLEATIPALDNKTPREAAQTPKGRKQLQRLLSTFADAEARKPPAERISLEKLYTELGVRP